MEYIRELLRGEDVPVPIVEEFMGLLELRLSPNYCMFLYLIHVFPENTGVPIGSPLGPSLSASRMRYLVLAPLCPLISSIGIGM